MTDGLAYTPGSTMTDAEAERRQMGPQQHGAVVYLDRDGALVLARLACELYLKGRVTEAEQAAWSARDLDPEWGGLYGSIYNNYDQAVNFTAWKQGLYEDVLGDFDDNEDEDE